MTDAPKPPASAGPAPILESPQATDFAAGLVRGGQLVGLDLGDKTIGVAVSIRETSRSPLSMASASAPSDSRSK